MNNIKRADGTFIKIDVRSRKTEMTCILFGGLGYSTNHPLLYYERNLMYQYGYNVVSIDFDYMNNEVFLSQNENEQDSYFDNDVEIIKEYMKSIRTKENVYIGKSMGTSIINRLLESDNIEKEGTLILLTPGVEWARIIKQLKQKKNKSLVIGSKGDPKYTIDELKNVYPLENVKVIEFGKENHSLETMNIDSDLDVLVKVIEESSIFITKR